MSQGEEDLINFKESTASESSHMVNVDDSSTLNKTFNSEQSRVPSQQAGCSSTSDKNENNQSEESFLKFNNLPQRSKFQKFNGITNFGVEQYIDNLVKHHTQIGHKHTDFSTDVLVDLDDSEETEEVAEVFLYLYDLCPSQLIKSVLGTEAVWHTSIVVFGVEVAYGIDGIGCVVPGEPLKKEYLGITDKKRHEMEPLLEEFQNDGFKQDQYDVFKNNCNHFSNLLSLRLVGDSIPRHIFELSEKYKNNLLAPLFISMFSSTTSNCVSNQEGNQVDQETTSNYKNSLQTFSTNKVASNCIKQSISNNKFKNILPDGIASSKSKNSNIINNFKSDHSKHSANSNQTAAVTSNTNQHFTSLNSGDSFQRTISNCIPGNSFISENKNVNERLNSISKNNKLYTNEELYEKNLNNFTEDKIKNSDETDSDTHVNARQSNPLYPDLSGMKHIYKDENLDKPINNFQKSLNMNRESKNIKTLNNTIDDKVSNKELVCDKFKINTPNKTLPNGAIRNTSNKDLLDEFLNSNNTETYTMNVSNTQLLCELNTGGGITIDANHDLRFSNEGHTGDFHFESTIYPTQINVTNSRTHKVSNSTHDPNSGRMNEVNDIVLSDEYMNTLAVKIAEKINLKLEGSVKSSSSTMGESSTSSRHVIESNIPSHSTRTNEILSVRNPVQRNTIIKNSVPSRSVELHLEDNNGPSGDTSSNLVQFD